MRNMLGGLLAAIIGSWLLVFILNLSQPAYPQELIFLWGLLTGSQYLSHTYTLLSDPFALVSYSAVWVIMGFIIAPFSKSGWNSVRTAVWTGVWVSVWALTSILLLDPAFWSDPNRNWSLLILFTSTIMTASISLLSAYPAARIIRLASRERELPIPEKIETRCQCGAVFKSKPIVCSECGRTLHNERTIDDNAYLSFSGDASPEDPTDYSSN
ncbi:MAG: hypothetical protein ACFFET_09865 [Candidatus Thorarchaeota archaeon]